MRKPLIRKSLIFLLLILGGVLIFITLKGRSPAENPERISRISFEEVEKEMIRRGLTESQLKDYSAQLRGMKVRWSGHLKMVGDDSTVYVAMNGEIPNIEFTLSQKTVKTLQKGQPMTFTGTIEAVSVTHTSPPVPKAYVVLDNVHLESH